jgi:hypothetical protein
MENTTETEKVKKTRGRKTHEVRDNKAYFTDYYAKKNKHIICECGLTITSFYKNKHKKQKIHNYLMENIKLREDAKLKETLGDLEKVELKETLGDTEKIDLDKIDLEKVEFGFSNLEKIDLDFGKY